MFLEVLKEERNLQGLVAYSSELCAPNPEVVEANVLFESEMKANV